MRKNSDTARRQLGLGTYAERHGVTQAPANALNIAVIGTGISGMSAAWLLSGRHRVTVYEQDARIGGHSNTVDAAFDGGTVPVDTGFIVYNEETYPNLTALFRHLNVPTEATSMSFGVSMDGGALEYSGGTGLTGLLAQPANLVRPRFWSMIRDLLRFYREAPGDIAAMETISIGDYLALKGYGARFRDDHLMPMAAAVWSASPATLMEYPAAAFTRFCDNHGLLKLKDRPVWRTVTGGSRAYVARLTASFQQHIRRGDAVITVSRNGDGVLVTTRAGTIEPYDHVVIATHADQALTLLSDPTAAESARLGAFRYERNTAVLHSDASFMPRRRAAWSAWNYLGESGSVHGLCVTYWMNRLQNLTTDRPLFVTLNPSRPPALDSLLHTEIYEHPIFDAAALAAQHGLWSLQGQNNTWFCGSYFGSGFHEDGLQAGLAVAEHLGGIWRPWSVENESGRIVAEVPALRSSAQAVAEALP
jgi:predicted NAD/FAD-binding protein